MITNSIICIYYVFSIDLGISWHNDMISYIHRYRPINANGICTDFGVFWNVLSLYFLVWRVCFWKFKQLAEAAGERGNNWPNSKFGQCCFTRFKTHSIWAAFVCPPLGKTTVSSFFSWSDQKVKPALIKDPAQDKCGLVMFVQYSDPGY